MRRVGIIINKVQLRDNCSSHIQGSWLWEWGRWGLRGVRALRAESSLTESFAPTAATGLSYPVPQELSDYNRPRSLQLANRFWTAWLWLQVAYKWHGASQISVVQIALRLRKRRDYHLQLGCLVHASAFQTFPTLNRASPPHTLPVDKTWWLLLRKKEDGREAWRAADREGGRQTDRDSDRQTDRQRQRQRQRQTERDRKTKTEKQRDKDRDRERDKERHRNKDRGRKRRDKDRDTNRETDSVTETRETDTERQRQRDRDSETETQMPLSLLRVQFAVLNIEPNQKRMEYVWYPHYTSVARGWHRRLWFPLATHGTSCKSKTSLKANHSAKCG